MHKTGLSIAMVIILLTITIQTYAGTKTTEELPEEQTPYPPPEMPPTRVDVSSNTISSTPYPEPIDSSFASPTEQLLLLDDMENIYFVYFPLIFGLPYDRAGAINYADFWAHQRNSDYPNYGSNCNCNDCTNYLSQALHNGRLPLRTGDWDENNIDEWWYRKILFWYQNSKTWSATDWFNIYIAQYSNQFEFRSWPTELEGGDFFLMDLHGEEIDDPPDGIPDHARFVVGYGYTSTDQEDYTDGCGSNQTIPASTYGLLVDQHCVDRKHVIWNYGVQGGIGYWPFHVR